MLSEGKKTRYDLKQFYFNVDVSTSKGEIVVSPFAREELDKIIETVSEHMERYLELQKANPNITLIEVVSELIKNEQGAKFAADIDYLLGKCCKVSGGEWIEISKKLAIVEWLGVVSIALGVNKDFFNQATREVGMISLFEEKKTPETPVLPSESGEKSSNA